jgi:small subunit ribosomal protein S15
MAKMHSRKKGSSRSRPRYSEKAPAWCDVSKEELQKLVLKLHEGGLSSSRIGLTLRDQYGVPSIKQILGMNLNRFLMQNTTVPEIPEDLGNLMRKALHVRKHLKNNNKDLHNKRALQLTESKIRRLVRYYQGSGRLSRSWEYKPETAEMLVT